MHVTRSDEQEFFRATTERFLVDHAPPSTLRQLRDDTTGLPPGYWTQGAQLGWTSLLVDEAKGGGSLSGAGLVDLSLVAYEFGRHAAPGPLVATNVVAAALSEEGDEAQAEVLAGLLSGESVASWCPATFAGGALSAGSIAIETQGGELVLTGVSKPVESAVLASHFLVTGREASGLTQVLVPASSSGLTVTPLQNIDVTRRFGALSFDAVRVPLSAVVGDAGEAAPALARQTRCALTLLNAEAVGAMQAGFDLTVEWAFDRYSFGRPLASYQALKHRFADMLAWLEASHGISDAGCVLAATDDSSEADELTSAAKAFVGQYGADLLHDCVQIHGGIGVTYEHDLHLYLRRFTLNRSLVGTPSEHRRRIAELVAAHAEVAA
jgi:alkylation response protein AidB-like acyl-CoA dehydrogenase